MVTLLNIDSLKFKNIKDNWFKIETKNMNNKKAQMKMFTYFLLLLS